MLKLLWPIIYIVTRGHACSQRQGWRSRGVANGNDRDGAAQLWTYLHQIVVWASRRRAITASCFCLKVLANPVLITASLASLRSPATRSQWAVRTRVLPVRIG